MAAVGDEPEPGRTLWNVGTVPALTFRAAARDAKYLRAFLFFAIASLCGVPAALFPKVFGAFSFARLVGDVPKIDLVAKHGLGGAAIRVALVGPISGLIGLLILAAVLNVALSALGVSKPPYARAARAVAYSSAIAAVLTLVPIAGQPAGLAWGAFVIYAAVAGLFDVTKVRAIVATAAYYAVLVGMQVVPALMQ